MIEVLSPTLTAPTLSTEQGNIVVLLERAAARGPSRPAVLEPDGSARWRFGDLAEAASRLAGGLRDRGVGPGDRVLALVPSADQFVLVAAAVLWVGALLIVPPRMRNWRDSLHLAGAGGPKAVIASAPLWPLVATQRSLRSAPLRIVTGRWRLPGTIPLAGLEGGPPIRPINVCPTDPAILSYSTGTTGVPKAVVRTHRVLATQHAALGTLRVEHDGAVDLPGLPLLALHNLARGVPSVLLPPGRVTDTGYGALLRRAIDQSAVTTIAGFPSLFDALCRGAMGGELSQLREIHVGGAPVRGDTLAALARTAPHAQATIVYGCTEAEPIAAIDAESYLSASAATSGLTGPCVGPPVPGLEVCVVPLTVTHAGRASGPAAAAIGRIQVRGERVAAPPDEDGREVWHDTGDLGWHGADGRLWLMGRAAHAGRDGLLPGEVEPVVEQLPWVKQAVMVQVPSSGRLQVTIAVEPRAKLRAAEAQNRRREVGDLLTERGWSVDLIAILGELPRDARSGSKIDYPALVAKLQS